MKIHYIFITFISITISSAWAQKYNNIGESDFLYGFLEGSYHLIGRLPDSNKTYSGKVVLRRTGKKLEVTRRIEGKEIKGIGKIETATADEIKVLQILFTQEDKSFEAIYLIDSDLDNYARLTGYLWLKGKEAKDPGLEALFIDHKSLQRKSIMNIPMQSNR